MNASTTVSVIIPVYNRAKVVEECIRSVLEQSHPLFEIILIDDGSTDNSAEVCSTLAAQDPRIKLLTGAHSGVSAARNIGLDAATGKYVFFLDSDDVIHPQLLEALVSGMEAHNAPLSGTKCAACKESVWAQVKPSFLQASLTPDAVFHNHQDTLQSVFRGGSPLGMIGGVMMRRDWIGTTRFRTDLFIGEDFYFIYENLIKGASAVFLKQKGYLNRLHSSNISWQYDFDGFRTRFYRRKLVWESEERFGRQEYAKLQKQQAFFAFLRCFPKNKPYSADSRKMRAALRQEQSKLLPALSAKYKLLFRLCLYCPGTAWLIFRLKNK